MPAAITDKAIKIKNQFATTLASQKNSGAGSMSLSDATGVPTDTAIIVTLGRVDANGDSTPTARAYYKGTLSGTTLSNLDFLDGTDQTHPAGTVVEITWTEDHWNPFVDSWLSQHKQTGAHGDVTADSITTAGAIDVADSTAIRDSSDNEFLKFSKTSSAVNEVTLANAATGGAPSLTASGGDTNVGLNLNGKGSGVVSMNVPYQTDNGNTIASLTDGIITVQFGWGQVLGNGNDTVNDAVTFPKAYSTILGVSVSYVGAKSTPAAATISDLSTSYASGSTAYNIYAVSPSTTGFTTGIHRDAGTFANTIYWGYSWIAWGIL